MGGIVSAIISNGVREALRDHHQPVEQVQTWSPLEMHRSRGGRLPETDFRARDQRLSQINEPLETVSHAREHRLSQIYEPFIYEPFEPTETDNRAPEQHPSQIYEPSVPPEPWQSTEIDDPCERTYPQMNNQIEESILPTALPAHCSIF